MNALELLFKTLKEKGFKLIHSDYNTHITKDDVMYMTINRHNWANEEVITSIIDCFKEVEVQE